MNFQKELGTQGPLGVWVPRAEPGVGGDSVVCSTAQPHGLVSEALGQMGTGLEKAFS